MSTAPENCGIVPGATQPKLTMFKVTTNHGKIWRQNQRVWVIFISGAQAAWVVGKYRGHGRYISGWVRWDDKHPIRQVECEVTTKFYNHIMHTAKRES